MYRSLIFDFFEVIHEDPLEPWLRQHDLMREGEIVQFCNLLDLGQINYQNFLQRLAKVSGQSAREVGEQFIALADIDHAVVDLIKDLRDDYRVGLLSNAHHEELRPLLDHHQLIPLFHEIIISAEVGLVKPNPKIFQLMMQRLRVQPYECVFIDDNPHNVAAAAKLGITGVCYKQSADLKYQLEKLGVASSEPVF